MEIHHKERKKKSAFRRVDSIILSTANEINAKILTKDNDFSGLKETILLKELKLF